MATKYFNTKEDMESIRTALQIITSPYKNPKIGLPTARDVSFYFATRITPAQRAARERLLKKLSE